MDITQPGGALAAAPVAQAAPRDVQRPVATATAVAAAPVATAARSPRMREAIPVTTVAVAQAKPVEDDGPKRHVQELLERVDKQVQEQAQRLHQDLQQKEALAALLREAQARLSELDAG